MVEQKQTKPPASRPIKAPVPRPAAAAATLTPKEIVGILRRHIWLMISMAIVGIMAGGASWYLLLRYNPKYTASTFIKVLPPTEKDPTTIGGAIVNKDLQYGHRLSVASLIKRQSSLQELIDKNKIQETKWFKKFGKSKGISIRRAYKNLKKRFGASASRDADFVTLSMTCGDKKEAALIVNQMVDLFLASQGSDKRKEVAAKLGTLKSQRDNVQRELRLAEEVLKSIRTGSGFTDLDDHVFEDKATKRLNELEREQNILFLDIQQAQATIGTFEEQATGPISDQVARLIETDPTMIMLLQRLALMRMDLAGAGTKFGENHRRVQQIQELVDRTEKEKESRKMDIAELTRQSNLKNSKDNLVILQSRLTASMEMINEAARQKSLYDLAKVQFEQHKKIRDERQTVLDDLKGQIDSRTIMHEDPETPKVQFAGYAPEPLMISSPLWYIYIPGGMFLGFFAGLGLAFLIELLNDLVRTPKDVSRHLHIPLLGVIPDVDQDEQVRDIDPCHVVRQAPYSVISESYRRFRTNLKLSELARSSKVLLVTSGGAGEGKTSVAVNLATAFTAESKKVLLIDTNFWRPSLHTVFTDQQTAEDEIVEQTDSGLSELLTGQSTFSDVLKPTGIEGCDMITSGSPPSNPAELLGGSQIETLIKQQSENYDYIIVDGPPVLLVSATKMLARFVDGTILVFNAAATKRGLAIRAIHELRQVNAPVVGCVLLGVVAMKGGYFQEQFKSLQDYQKLQLAHSV